MAPADRTFGLFINKEDMDCVMCSLDQIDRRMNMYKDKAGRVLRLVDLADEEATVTTTKGGKGRVVQQRRR